MRNLSEIPIARSKYQNDGICRSGNKWEEKRRRALHVVTRTHVQGRGGEGKGNKIKRDISQLLLLLLLLLLQSETAHAHLLLPCCPLKAFVRLYVCAFINAQK
jgi:hypothetical protein